MRAERHEAEQHALRVASRFILPQRVLISYEEWKEEFGTMAEGRQAEEGYDKGHQQQQQQGSKQLQESNEQHHLQQGCVWTIMEAGPRWRLGGGLIPPFSLD